MPIHTGRLVLTPADPLLAPLTQDLRQTLEQLGFLGPSLPAARAALVRHGQGIIQSLGSDQDPDQGAHPCAGQGRSHGFLAGEQFLALLAFAGCSVNVDLAPKPGGGPFTHIRLLGPLPQPRLLAGRNTRPPRCPRCRTPYRDWQPALTSAVIPTWVCPACARVRPAWARVRPAWAWDWRNQGGYGRSFIAVEEVFPGEAEPAPALLAALQRLTSTPWRHFSIQDEMT